jgi:hypothetical protein
MGLGLSHSTDAVLRNPRWSRAFTIFKRTRAADEHGRPITEESVIEAAGVIQPAGGDDLDRLMGSDRAAGGITVWTDAPLSAGTGNDLPDEVVWRDARYMVVHVRDWTDYGLGWRKAICAAQSMRESMT